MVDERNQYGGIRPDPAEASVIRAVRQHRLEHGVHYYARYHIAEVVKGLRVKQPIEAFSLLDSATVNRAKLNYLAQDNVRVRQFGELLGYFDQVFPVRRQNFNHRQVDVNEPHSNVRDPLYMDPMELVLFHYSDSEGNPETFLILPENRQGDTMGVGREFPNNEWGNQLENIRRAKNSLAAALRYAEYGQGHWNEGAVFDSGWLLDLRYNLKRVLVDLHDHYNPDRIKLAIKVLASVGNVCGPGNHEGSALLATAFFQGENGLGQEPRTYKERILAKLDKLREEVFLKAVSFANDRQSAHTKNYWKNLFAQSFKIPPNENDPHMGVGLHDISTEEFARRLMSGKIGNPWVERDDRARQGTREEMELIAEAHRSHKGYTPNEIAQAVIQALQLEGDSPIFMDLIRPDLTQGLTAPQIREWVYHQDNVRQIVAKALLLEPEDFTVEQARTELDHLHDHQGPTEAELKEMYSSNKFFMSVAVRVRGHEEEKPYLNEDGLRELLLKLNILEVGEPRPLRQNL